MHINWFGTGSHNHGPMVGDGKHDRGFNSFKSAVDSNAHILLNTCIIQLP